jgi:hypothetical protein
VAANGVMGKGKTPAQDRLCLLAGTKVPLAPDVLRRLYTSKADYVAQVDRRLKELVDAGLVPAGVMPTPSGPTRARRACRSARPAPQ